MCLIAFLPKSYAFQSLQNGEISVDGVLFTEIETAATAIKDGSKVFIGPGVYNQGMDITANNVVISGSFDRPHFKGAVTKNGATFNVMGDNIRLENIECSNALHSSRKGTCVSHSGENLTVTNVYFHDGERGIISGKDSGTLIVEYSKLERLGKDGKAHPITSSGNELIIRYSDILDATDQAHEISTKAIKTVIEFSRIGSVTSDDSRIIDMPAGGEIIIRNSILIKNKNTVNRQLIGFGLGEMARHRPHSILLANNLLFAERDGPNEVLALPGSPNQSISVAVEENIIVGHQIIDKDNYSEDNRFIENRADLKLEKILPEISIIDALKILEPGN